MNIFTKKGYVAISSILVITAIITTIGISISLSSINNLQISLASKKNEEAVNFVEGCAEDALLRLNEDNLIPTNIALPEGNCSVTIDLQSGTDWTFTINGSIDNYAKSFQISATRDSSVQIISWQEI